MKKIAFFLAAMCCAVSLYAADCERGGNCGIDDQNLIAWTYNEGVLSFYGSGVMASYDALNPAPWDCWKDEITAVVFEHNVSFIGAYAFNGLTHLATVQFPRAIFEQTATQKADSFEIGQYAFAGCTALEQVIIPAQAKSIDANAFNGAGLQTVYLLGANLYELQNSVPFNGCASLEHIYVPAGSLADYQAAWASLASKLAEGAPAQIAVGEIVVDGDFTYTVVNVEDRIMSVKRTSGLEIRFKDKVVYKGMVWNVKELAANAFANATFDRYDIPSYINKIGAGAFSGCSNLYIVEASATTPAELGANVFDGLPAEYTINVVDELEDAYKAAWSAYASHINKGVAPYAVDVEIGDLTYYLRGNGTKTAQITGIAGNPSEITIPATVEYEGYTYAVNSIEANAFVGNTSVEKVILAVDLHKEDITEGIGMSISFDKAQLDDLLANHQITQEQYNAILYGTGQATSAFSPDNTTLKEVVIAEGVTRIPAALFGGLQGIEKVTIPASVTAIEEDAFLNCNGITSVISRATSPIDLSAFYRVFPMKNDTRILYVTYTARNAYRDALWNRFFFFDEDAEAANQDNVNVASLESEETSDADLQTTLEAMVQTAAEAEANPEVQTVTTNLTIQRKLYKDGWLNTICLPFDVATLDGTPLEGGEIFEFDHANVDMSGSAASLDMVVVPTDHMEAGKPYFIRWANTGEVLEEMEFKNIAITQTTGLEVQGTEGNVRFKGHLGMIHIEKEDELSSDYCNLYLIAGNQFRWPVANDVTNMKGFRAYFRVKVSGAGAPRRGAPARIIFAEKNTTAINNVEAVKGARKMIENGQLVIIREGIRYNAAGQIVK